MNVSQPRYLARLTCATIIIIGGTSFCGAEVDSGTQTAAVVDSIDWGKSHHGAHYDEGPRSKPILMTGIGSTHFPVTSTHPKVQQWFDQGHTLLHGFWPFEAERSFRWCIKLDPNCAMAYWGLSRCCEQDDERAAKFLQEAVALKDKVSPRERDYIELWVKKAKVEKAKKLAKKAGGEDKEARASVEKASKAYAIAFDKLLMKYPDDMEARALYWLDLPRTLNDNAQEHFNPYRFGMERVLQEVLTKDPDHVGALHYRIHNWDSREGVNALDSCLKLSEVAPKSGHLQHMPGHVLSGIGLWHEAAIAMDSATRVEKEYMHEHMIRPDQNWNYAHNLDYLCFIQEQLGMFDEAMIGVKQLAAAPQSTKMQAAIGDAIVKSAVVRLLVKSERWNEILDPTTEIVRWNLKSPIDSLLHGYMRTHALIAMGKLDEAEKALQELKDPTPTKSKGRPPRSKTKGGKNSDSPKAAGPKESPEKDGSQQPAGPPPAMIEKFLGKSIKLQELEAKLLCAQGKHLEGIAMLTAAAQTQAEDWSNDPPTHPMFLYNTLGDTYFELGSMPLAIAAYQKTLETIANDGFALSGLVQAYANLQEMKEARSALSKLKAVWSDANRPNRRLELALATGVEASPDLNAPIVERNYKREVLDKKGSSLWTPTPAPPFAVPDSSGKTIQLSDFAGKHVVLIFYQGGQCLHCMDQMRKANELVKDFEKLDAVFVAISKDDRETLEGYDEDFDITLLSDPDFATSRAYRSFDDFEEIELHSTVLIDKLGRVHWSQHGGEPFMKFDFLKSEIEKLNGFRGDSP